MSRRVAAVVVAGVATALVAAGDVLVLVHHQRHWPHGFGVWLEGSLSLPVWLAIGLLLVFRVPRNVLGPVAMGFALLDGVHMFSGSLATFMAGDGHPTRACNEVAGVAVIAQMAVVGGIIVFAQLAPDGRQVSRRWWLFTAATTLAMTLAGVANLGSASDMHDSVPAANVAVQGMSPGLLHALYSVANALVFTGIAGALAGIIVRWRRGSALQRQQLKLVAYAVVTAAFLGAVVQPIGSVLWPHAELAGSIMWTIIPSILPASVTAAVLRYRLYDIDRVVSRTVSYAVVTGVVAAFYVGTVALADRALGFSSSVAVAASTLAAVAVCQPVRRRMQGWVDRRFNRVAYDARRTVESFTARLRDQVDVDAVRGDLLGTIAHAVAPGTVSLWVPS